MQKENNALHNWRAHQSNLPSDLNNLTALVEPLSHQWSVETRQNIARIPSSEKAAIPAKPLMRGSRQLKTLPPDLLPDEFSWGSPAPITPRPLQQEYPVAALPLILREAVLEIRELTLAPLGMIACSAISALSCAAQGLIDVQRDRHLIGPSSLFFVILGDSGERKSTVDALFCRPINEFQKSLEEKGKILGATYQAELMAWEAAVEGTRNALKLRSKKGKTKENSEDLELSLHNAYQQKPVRPLIPNLLVTDITNEKLVHQLANEWPLCYLNSPEAGVVLGSRSFSKESIMTSLSTMSAIWSDESIRVSRKTSESFNCTRARLTISLLLQSSIFSRFTQENDIMRNGGFLGRCLFAFPQTTQGQRIYQEQSVQLPALERLHKCITDLLNTAPAFEDRVVKPNIVPLNREAKDEWVKFYNEIEAELAPGCKYEQLRDFGSKAPENAARLAAILQASKSFPFTTIDLDSMQAACKIVAWHLSEAEIFFTKSSPEQESVAQAAEKLEKWLKKTIAETGALAIEISDIMALGPSIVRKQQKLLDAANILQNRNRARLIANGRFIALNPSFVSDEVKH